MSLEIPTRLQHALSVVEVIRTTGVSRAKAVQQVAEERGLHQSTVMDACARSLRIRTADLDRMLASKGLHEYEKHLMTAYPACRDEIAQAFRN